MFSFLFLVWPVLGIGFCLIWVLLLCIPSCVLLLNCLSQYGHVAILVFLFKPVFKEQGWFAECFLYDFCYSIFRPQRY